jgi:hypothetical protein
MTWVDPESRDTGELITAAIWNQDVVANTQWLKDTFPGGISAWVYNNANISWPTNSYITAVFNSELWDTSGFHSTTSNTHLLTAPQDGLYLVGATLHFSQTDHFRVRIYKNGSIRIGDSSGGGRVSYGCNVMAIANLAEGDYITVLGYHEEGSTQSMIADTYIGISAWIVLIGEKPT